MAKANSTKKSTGKTKIQPLSDRVLVRVDDEKGEHTTASGIILPSGAGEDRGSKQGTVVAVGPGHYDDGKLIPVKLKEGDVVLFQWGDEIKIDGVTYHILSESNILAIIK